MGSGASKAKEKYRADDVAEQDVGARFPQLPPLDVKASPTAVEVRPSPSDAGSPGAVVSPSRPSSWRGRESPSRVPDPVAQAPPPDPAALVLDETPVILGSRRELGGQLGALKSSGRRWGGAQAESLVEEKPNPVDEQLARSELNGLVSAPTAELHNILSGFAPPAAPARAVPASGAPAPSPAAEAGLPTFGTPAPAPGSAGAMPTPQPEELVRPPTVDADPFGQLRDQFPVPDVEEDPEPLIDPFRELSAGVTPGSPERDQPPSPGAGVGLAPSAGGGPKPPPPPLPSHAKGSFKAAQLANALPVQAQNDAPLPADPSLPEWMPVERRAPDESQGSPQRARPAPAAAEAPKPAPPPKPSGPPQLKAALANAAMPPPPPKPKGPPKLKADQKSQADIQAEDQARFYEAATPSMPPPPPKPKGPPKVKAAEPAGGQEAPQPSPKSRKQSQVNFSEQLAEFVTPPRPPTEPGARPGHAFAPDGAAAPSWAGGPGPGVALREAEAKARAQAEAAAPAVDAGVPQWASSGSAGAPAARAAGVVRAEVNPLVAQRDSSPEPAGTNKPIATAENRGALPQDLFSALGLPALANMPPSSGRKEQPRIAEGSRNVRKIRSGGYRARSDEAVSPPTTASSGASADVAVI